MCNQGAGYVGGFVLCPLITPCLVHRRLFCVVVVVVLVVVRYGYIGPSTRPLTVPRDRRVGTAALLSLPRFRDSGRRHNGLSLLCTS